MWFVVRGHQRRRRGQLRPTDFDGNMFILHIVFSAFVDGTIVVNTIGRCVGIVFNNFQKIFRVEKIAADRR